MDPEFKKNFEKAMLHPKMWYPYYGTNKIDPANTLYYWIEQNFPSDLELAEYMNVTPYGKYSKDPNRYKQPGQITADVLRR